jgi:hypothetical protein
MGKPKQHHFVPQWYLEQFVDEEGFLHLYDKRNGLWRRQKPRKTMRRNGYYKQDWAPDGIDPNILEHKFAELEGQARAAFSRLPRPEELTVMEWTYIMIYLQVQRIRVPRQAEQAKELIRSFVLVHGSPKATEKVLTGKWALNISDGFRFDFMKLIGTLYVKAFIRMQWEIFDSGNEVYVTSDSPVSLFNPDFRPPFEPGIGLAGTLVLFPINPKKLLVLRHPEQGKMGPSEPVDLDAEPDDHLRYSVWEEPMTPDQVHLHNQMMVSLADRLVAAPEKGALEVSVGRELSGG